MTDSRDTRNPSVPDQKIEDMDSLAREIDELARQRERIFQAMRPAASRSSQESLSARADKLETENKILKERLAEVTSSNSVNLAEKLRKAEQLLEERTSELQQLRKQGESDAALLDELKKQSDVIEQLKSRLADARNDQAGVVPLQEELRRLKINLADAVLEQKQAGAANLELQKQIIELKQEIFQHQSQIRDLSARLDLSKRNEQALSVQEKQQEIELLRLRTSSEDSTQQKTQLTQQLKTVSAELEKYRTDLEKAHNFISELQAAHARVRSEYESEKIQRQAAETREHDIVLALDAISQERQMLKEKVSRLLVGVKDYITPPFRPGPSATDDGILEPREMHPYIPFCFPDSLPAQLRPSWKRTKKLPLLHQPGSLTRIHSESFPRSIRKPLAQPYRLPDLLCPPLASMPTKPFKQSLPKQVFIEYGLAALEMPVGRSARSFPESELLSSSIEKRFPARSLTPEMQVRLTVAPVTAKIVTNSATLFFDYLANDIVASFHNLLSHLEYRYPPDSPGKPKNFLHDSQTISSGRVALHTTSHLQFALRYPVRSAMHPCIPDGRLKYLLRTIGDSLSSMMARLDNKEPDDESGS